MVQGFLQFCRDGTFSPHFLRSWQLKQSSRWVIFREFFYGGPWVAGGIGVRFFDKRAAIVLFLAVLVRSSIRGVSSGIVIDHLARNGNCTGQREVNVLKRPVRGRKRSALWRRKSPSACNDANIVPGPNLCSRGPSPRRSLQRASRPASGPPTADGTMAGAIGDRLVGPQKAARNGFLSVADHILGPHLIDGAMRHALVPSNRSELTETSPTPRIAVSKAPSKPFLSAHWPGTGRFELGSGEVGDF